MEKIPKEEFEKEKKIKRRQGHISTNYLPFEPEREREIT